MFKRSLFWIGLSLGTLAAFGTRRRWMPSRTDALDPLLDLVSDAVVLCDASGAVTDANAAAAALFGPGGAGLFRLSYPSGQPVPPGQLPSARVLRTGRATDGAGYRFLSAEGKSHVLDIQAKPLSDGGVIVTARDRTGAAEGHARETKVQGRDEILRALCRRLCAAPDAEELAQALVDAARTLMGPLPNVQARLYTYDSGAGLLTRIASAPAERPRRARSQRQSQPPAFPFEASSPPLWSVYIERRPVFHGDAAGVSPFPASWGEETHGSACALPLLAGGVALGHLSLTCPAADAFAAPDLRETLGLLTSVAALALAGPRLAASADDLAAQVGALRAVIQAVAEKTEPGALADRVSREVRRVTGAELCTLALRDERGLPLAGTAYQDELLFPDRYTPADPALIDEAAREAVRNGETIQRRGRANPHFEDGVWRAFAGQSGRHSVVAVPLKAGQGVLTVSAAGEAPFPEPQVRFLETLAALISAALPEASRTAEHTGV